MRTTLHLCYVGRQITPPQLLHYYRLQFQPAKYLSATE